MRKAFIRLFFKFNNHICSVNNVIKAGSFYCLGVLTKPIVQFTRQHYRLKYFRGLLAESGGEFALVLFDFIDVPFNIFFAVQVCKNLWINGIFRSTFFPQADKHPQWLDENIRTRRGLILFLMLLKPIISLNYYITWFFFIVGYDTCYAIHNRGARNPGEEYENTRHNVGRMFVEYLKKKEDFPEWREDKKLKAVTSEGKVGKGKVLLVKPNNFMNNSGKSLLPLVKNKKQAEQLVIIYDDLDLPLGTLKVSFNRGAGGTGP